MDIPSPRLPRPLLAAAALAVLLVLPGGPAAAADRPSPPDLSGRWAQVQVVTDVTNIPLVGDVEMEGTTLLLLDVEQEGTRLEIRETVCAVRVKSSSTDVRTSVSPGFAKGLSGAIRDGRLTWRKGRWEYREPKLVVVHGAKLERPAKDPLPEDDDDPRLVDGDEDGHPGLTATVSGLVNGSVRIVQRLWNDLRGLVRSPDHVEGLMSWGREQNVVDATSLLLRKAMPTRPHPDPTKSRFSMRRVPPDTDCKALKKDPRRYLEP